MFKKIKSGTSYDLKKSNPMQKINKLVQVLDKYHELTFNWRI